MAPPPGLPPVIGLSTIAFLRRIRACPLSTVHCSLHAVCVFVEGVDKGIAGLAGAGNNAVSFSKRVAALRGSDPGWKGNRKLRDEAPAACRTSEKGLGRMADGQPEAPPAPRPGSRPLARFLCEKLFLLPLPSPHRWEQGTGHKASAPPPLTVAVAHPCSRFQVPCPIPVVHLLTVWKNALQEFTHLLHTPVSFSIRVVATQGEGTHSGVRGQPQGSRAADLEPW
jgi:hypothetical protein